jgi:hypothetical protein
VELESQEGQRETQASVLTQHEEQRNANGMNNSKASLRIRAYDHSCPFHQIYRHDHYPNTLNAAYTMLVNYVNPNQERTFDIQDGGLLYFHNEEEVDDKQDQNCRQGCWRGSWIPRGGRNPCGCGQYQDAHQEAHSIHEHNVNAGTVAGDDNNTNTNIACYLSASFNVSYAETYIVKTGRLLMGWILLDSGSTTNIISDRDLLHDIHPATNPIWISSIARRATWELIRTLSGTTQK